MACRVGGDHALQATNQKCPYSVATWPWCFGRTTPRSSSPAPWCIPTTSTHPRRANVLPLELHMPIGRLGFATAVSPGLACCQARPAGKPPFAYGIWPRPGRGCGKAQVVMANECRHCTNGKCICLVPGMPTWSATHALGVRAWALVGPTRLVGIAQICLVRAAQAQCAPHKGSLGG